MIHIGAVVSYLPPPLLNLKKQTNASNNSDTAAAPVDDEFNKTIVCAFEESGLDFKRQNSLEKNDESRMMQNLNYLTTNNLSTLPDMNKTGCIQATEMNIKKSYGDSFNDDLFELHSFTRVFTHTLEKLTDIITALDKIPNS